MNSVQRILIATALKPVKRTEMRKEVLMTMTTNYIMKYHPMEFASLVANTPKEERAVLQDMILKGITTMEFINYEHDQFNKTTTI